MRFVLLVTIWLISQSALAHWEKIPSKSFTLGPPPAEGSAQEKADFKRLHEYQQTRSAEDCEAGSEMVTPSVETLFAGEYGVLTQDELATVKPLMDKVFRFAERVSTYFKNKYKRPRPYDVDTTLRPCAPLPGGSKAYPSTHALMGYVGACILGEVYADDREHLMKHGKHLGELRAIVGVHHPSDIAASWKLGKDICETLIEDPTFQNALGSLETPLPN